MPTPTTRFDGLLKPTDADDFITEDIAANWEKVATQGAGFLSGTAANRPAASAAVVRYFYWAHDTQTLSKCIDTDGTATTFVWVTLAGQVLIWNGVDNYIPAELRSSTATKEFRGPTDPASIAGITVNEYDTWVNTT